MVLNISVVRIDPIRHLTDPVLPRAIPVLPGLDRYLPDYHLLDPPSEPDRNLSEAGRLERYPGRPTRQ
jgi:hypothetical protein